MTRIPLQVALAVALTASLLGPSVALADEPSAADRETARDLLIDGRKKLEKKDYEGALKSLKAAHSIMNVPTTGLDYALALEAVGQIIEARIRGPRGDPHAPRSGEPEAFADARASATVLAERLAGRVAAVVLTVKGLPSGVEPALTIDGVALPTATIGLPRKVDPGAHTLAARAPGFATVEKRVELRDGATLPVELTFGAAGAAPEPRTSPPPAKPPITKGTAAPPPRAKPLVRSEVKSEVPPPPPSEPRRVPTWAWISGGIGVVALGASVGFAVDYGSVRSSVTGACPGDVCQGHLPDDLGHWNRDLGLFIGLGAVGVAAVATAAVGALGRPRARVGSITLSPWLAPPGHDGSAAGAALTGAF